MQMQMQIYTSTNNTTTLWRVKLWCNEIEMDQFLDGKNLVDDEDEEEEDDDDDDDGLPRQKAAVLAGQ